MPQSDESPVVRWVKVLAASAGILAFCGTVSILLFSNYFQSKADAQAMKVELVAELTAANGVQDKVTETILVTLKEIKATVEQVRDDVAYMRGQADKTR